MDTFVVALVSAPPCAAPLRGARPNCSAVARARSVPCIDQSVCCGTLRPCHVSASPQALLTSSRTLLASCFGAGGPAAPRQGCRLCGVLHCSAPCSPEGQLWGCWQPGPSRLLLLAIANPCTGCKPKHGWVSLPGTSASRAGGWPERGGSLPSPTPAQDCGSPCSSGACCGCGRSRLSPARQGRGRRAGKSALGVKRHGGGCPPAQG